MASFDAASIVSGGCFTRCACGSVAEGRGRESEGDTMMLPVNAAKRCFFFIRMMQYVKTDGKKTSGNIGSIELFGRNGA